MSPDLLDHLRIVAADGGKLSEEACARIAEPADDYEGVHRLLLETQEKLILSNWQRIALHERLVDVARMYAVDLTELREKFNRYREME